jgi:hypothetical protein
MEKEFVPYELALRMKQLGFDEECFYVKPLKKKTKCFYTPSDYDDFPEQKELEVGMPLFQQAFRWFREKYQLQGYVYSTTVRGGKDGKCFSDYCWNINGIDLPFLRTDARDMEKISYQEAELACLEKLIEIVENK